MAEQHGAHDVQPQVSHAAPAGEYHESHGNSTAAWTGVTIILVAAVLVGLGMVLDIPLLWIIGAAGVVVGGVAWIVLLKAGYGEGGRRL